jgi:N-acetylglucosaminyl-diphospho-decaprenol L-rhamnosyltransferase
VRLVAVETPRDLEVTIATMDNRELLRRCLSSLQAACEGLTWRATVIDNRSRDGTAEMVAQEFPWVRITCNQRPLGFSANHNQVLRELLKSGNSRYVLLLNDDTVLGEDSVARLVRFCDARPRVGAAGPTIVDRAGQVQPSFTSFPGLREHALEPLRLSQGVPSPANGSGWLDGACLLLRATALTDVGLLDERFFMYYEDTDFGLRLRTAGWDIDLCPDARIVHYGRQTVSQLSRATDMDRQLLRSRYLYFQKHRNEATARSVSALTRVTLYLRALKAYACGRRDAARSLSQLALYDPRVPLRHEATDRSQPR